MGLLSLFKRKPTPLELDIKRVREAREYMNKWDDMPMSYLYPELNRIVGVKETVDATELFVAIRLRTHSDVELATSLLNHKNGLNRTA